MVRLGRVVFLLVAIGSAALLAVVLAWRSSIPFSPRPGLVRFALAMPGGARFSAGTAQFAVAPDGRAVAVALGSADAVRLWIQDLDPSAKARPLAGTDGVSSTPAWSPDGRHLAFIAGGTLKRIGLGDGAVDAISDLEDGAAVDWGGDETLLIGEGGGAPIRRIGASGGMLQPITRLNPGEQHMGPRFVPGTRRFLFAVQADPLRDGVWLGSFDGGTGTRLVPQAMSAQVSGDFLVYAQGRTIVAQRFDAASGTLAGEPTTVIDNVRMEQPSGRAAFSASRANAVLVYQGGQDESLQVIAGWPSLVDPPR